MNSLHEFFSRSEYLHVLVNPVLTHVLPFAALGLLLALLGRSPGGTKIALVLVFLSAAAVWPTVHFGHEAFDRVRSMADDTGGDWLLIHRHRAEKGAVVFYVTAAVALVTLLVSLKWPKGSVRLSWLTLVVSLFACAAAIRIAAPAGKIRHREFRHAAPPAAELQAAKQAAGED
ncbi:MAG: hypothetical protein ABI273_03255 [Lacunisphaera sp.]